MGVRSGRWEEEVGDKIDVWREKKGTKTSLNPVVPNVGHTPTGGQFDF